MDINYILKTLFDTLPKFSDGRIDYTNSQRAVVITVFVEYKGKLLLLKRSNKVNAYKGMWSTVAGYVDKLESIENRVKQELKEELDVVESDIKEFKIGECYEFKDESINKIWIKCPYLVILNKQKEIKLDWEHTEYKWIDPKDITNYDIVPNPDESLNKFLRI